MIANTGQMNLSVHTKSFEYVFAGWISTYLLIDNLMS